MDKQTSQTDVSLIHQSQIPPGTVKQRHLAASTVIAKGDLYYGDGNNNFTKLAVGSAGQFLSVVSGAPSWSGALIPQSYTTTQRNALTGVVKGTIIYNTSTNKLNVYTGSWEAITSA